MTPDTITQRIHDKSDKDLSAEISKALNPLWDEARNVNFDSKNVDKSTLDRIQGELKECLDCTLRSRLPAIGTIHRVYCMILEEYLRNHRREKALDAFMTKVNTLSTQIDELRATVEDLPQQQ